MLVASTLEGLEATRAEIAQTGAHGVVSQADIRDPNDVEALAQATQRCRLVHRLVNNSGIAGPTGELWTLELDDWNETWRVNVTGVFLLCKGVPSLDDRGKGGKHLVERAPLVGDAAAISQTAPASLANIIPRARPARTPR